MKLLFLDMDGVLNSYQSSHYFWKTKHNRTCFMCDFDTLCPIACSNLDYILEKVPDLKVVISSTWRKFHQLNEWDEKMSIVCPSIVGRVISKTPDLDRVAGTRIPRGHEIHSWLTTNGHLETPYVVLDDDRDMDKVQENFIYIDNKVGLNWNHVEEIFKRWNVKG